MVGNVALLGSGNLLLAAPGATFPLQTGQRIDGGGGELELAAPTAGASAGGAAASVGTLAGIGSSFVNFGTLVVDIGAAWEISGDAGAYRFLNDGTIIVANGIVAAGDALVFGVLGEDPGEHGVIDLGNSGTAEFTGAVDGGQTLVFTDATATLQLADPGQFTARISDFRSGDVIDFVDTAVTAYRYAKGTLALSGNDGAVGVLLFAGRYGRHDFQLS
ncbi:MAG TPA: hypothetical protein VEK75_16270, partial [Xanthobacteraceae bacterium]|nr:hypothetical protein [Xanthobacteraceae bacterium]